MSWSLFYPQDIEPGRGEAEPCFGWLHVSPPSLGPPTLHSLLIRDIDHTITLLTVFILPRFLGGRPTAFKPSGSLSSELSERTPHLRAPLARRLKVILWDYSAFMHVFYIIFVLAAVALSTTRCLNKESSTLRDKLLCLLTHAFWPPVSWITSVVAAWIPIKYALWPPKVGEMEDLLERRGKRGPMYPGSEKKRVQEKWGEWGYEALYSLMTVYTFVAFAGTWLV